MMKKCIIHIYIMALLASLLASCSSILDEETNRGQDKIGIIFTLSMNSVGATSRALTADRVTQYENTIDQDKFRILAYTADGKAHEVTIFSMSKISDSTYEISGELKGVYAINKVVVLANCYSSYNLADKLSLLLYTYSNSDMNPESPKTYIPMWGEKAINATLRPGTSTDLGMIYLMRAMAKISVKSTGKEELNSVTLQNVNDRGYFISTNVIGTGEDLSVTSPTIPSGISKMKPLPFYKLDNKEAFIYLPEQERRDRPKMIIKLGGKDYTLPFMDYREFEQGASCPVLRNTHYLFNVSVKAAANLDFKVEYKVVPWGTEDIEIDFN